MAYRVSFVKNSPLIVGIHVGLLPRKRSIMSLRTVVGTLIPGRNLGKLSTPLVSIYSLYLMGPRLRYHLDSAL